MPANMVTERIPPRARSPRFSALAAATDKIVISRNVLIGLCLTTFAFGIVTTLAIDHMHARAAEGAAPREPDPVVLETTTIEPLAKSAAAAAVAPAPPAAADEAVVVQLPPIAERSVGRSAEKSGGKSGGKSAGKAAAMSATHLPPLSPSHSARPVGAAPIRTRQLTSRKRTSVTVQGNSSSSATEAAPLMPAPARKKWVDPFDQ